VRWKRFRILNRQSKCDANSFFTGYFLAMINDINCGFVSDARAQRRSESCTDQHGHTLDVNLNVYPKRHSNAGSKPFNARICDGELNFSLNAVILRLDREEWLPARNVQRVECQVANQRRDRQYGPADNAHRLVQLARWRG
jgi:hypothetical protein